MSSTESVNSGIQMIEPFLSFEWHVWPAYEWRDLLDRNGQPIKVSARGLRSLESASAVESAWQAQDGKGHMTGPVLKAVFAKGNPQSYLPMAREHAALFLKFAELDYRDPNTIAAFASRYGLLGASPSGSHGEESHLTWAREICLMQEALDLGQPTTPRAEARDKEIWSRYDATMRERWSAQGYDQDPVDYRRRERREKLTWLFNVHLQRVQPRIAFAETVPPRLTFAPLTLLAAMWLQLTLAVVGDKRFLACKFCQRVFEISTDVNGFRRHREFCSDSCKTLDYRRRKRNALKMAAEGRQINEIAKATATASSTVTSWTRLEKRRTTRIKKRRTRND